MLDEETSGQPGYGLREMFGAGGAEDRRRSATAWSTPRPSVVAAGPTRQRISRGNRWALGLSLLGTLSWVLACLRMDPTSYTDLGLVSATDGFFWVALTCAVAAFTCALRATRFRWPVALVSLLVIVAVLYATPSWIEGTPRVEAVYRHIGIADSFALNGTLQRHLDAYFNWPGLFAALGMLQKSAGLPDLIAIARWAPPVAILGYVAPALLIARSLTAKSRVQWLAVGVFVVVDWTGQDYMSPQTFAFWLLMCIAGIVMTVIRRWDDPDHEGPSARLRPIERLRARLRPQQAAARVDGAHRLWVGEAGRRVRLSRAQWRAVHLVVALGGSALIASHQLTPFMLVLVLFALWLVGRTPHWQLWFGAGVLVLAWLLVPAWPFVSGHIGEITGGLTNTSSGASQNLGGRTASGSAQHHLVVNAIMVETLAVWLLAGLGTLLLVSERRRVRAVLLLAGMPFLLVPLQTYGGEMLIRAYLFSLPLVGFLVAVFLHAATRRRPTDRRPWRGVALAVVLLVLASTTVLTRYGNERGDSFRPAEVNLYSWFFEHTPKESTVELIDANSPRNWHRYAYDVWMYYEEAAPGPRWEKDPTADRLLADIAKRGHNRKHAYVIYTPSMARMAQLSGNAPASTFTKVIDELDHDPRFKLIHRTSGGSVWEVVGS
ncbi:hypothetical protein D9V37_12545 [Nocardioides mangrovicus]|uniref:Glycosyltransferase RgtA/B/C/D-like domain-containing protein n=1 Tax=Nocardioides mangrovicus TaxID=2478913 RepID=A0A3L8P2Z9_9ACTN|nr:hypothetical protein D9V37_12545 [Nocardioides mangrovicus]